MRRPSFTDFDRPYRRGVVLGLSLAELFIILIFLLLMAMIGYAASREMELEEYLGLLEDAAVEKRSYIKKVHAGDELRDELSKALEQAVKERNEANERADTAEEKLGNIIEDDDPNDLIIQLTTVNEKLTRDIEELQDSLAAAVSDAQIGKQVREASYILDVDILEILSGTKGIAKLVEHIADLEEQVAGLEQTLAQKGQDSPCWYKMAKRGNGESYEKALYIFDIRISDRYIFVKDILAPTNAHQVQKARLEFNRAALNRDLDYDKFLPAFQSLRVAGENREVRDDRRCTFYVRVWDATGSSNKRGYKRAHNDIVQNIFNTFEIKNDPWPHS